MTVGSNDFKVTFDGVDAMVDTIREMADRGPVVAKAAAQKVATRFIRNAKLYSTGPPRIAGRVRRTRAKKGQPSRILSSQDGGPGVLTGYMRNSLQIRESSSYGAFAWQIKVYPDGPYYRRLELGFRGRDSIGRRYNQPPYPFMRPALNDTIAVAQRVAMPEFRKAVA